VQIAFILIGALVGALALEAGGALLGAALGWLVARQLAMQRELKALQEQLAQWARVADPAAVRTLDGTAGPAPAPAPTPEPAPVTGAVTGAGTSAVTIPVSAAVMATAAVSVAAPDTATANAPAAPPTRPPVPPPAASPPQRSPGILQRLRGWLLGGNTVVKAGVGILFIGLAFLAKYTAEQVQVPIELRLAGIGGVALVLLALGWRLRKTRAAYAQVLQGGAVATLYLTLFAAFRFYGLLSGGAALGAMALVAGLAAALAVLQNARSLAIIGSPGGFATPILVSTGEGNQVALFSWYLLLTLGIAAVAWFRSWRALNLIAFYCTAAVATVWGLARYDATHYLSSQLFLVAFFGVFVALLLLPARHQAADAVAGGGAEGRWVNGSLLFGLPTVVFALQHGLVRHTEYGTALSALALAAFYIGLATALRSRPRLALAFEGCLAVGTVFVTLVIPFALDARSTAGAWALEGAGLVWLGWRQQRRLARVFGYGLIAVAGALLLLNMVSIAAPSGWVNATLISGLMLMAGALVAAWCVRRHAQPAPEQDAAVAAGPASPPRRYPLMPAESIAEPLLIAASVLVSLALLLWHVDTLVSSPWDGAALVLGLAGLALLHTVLADRLAWPQVAGPVLAYAPLLLAGAALAPLGPSPVWAHGGWWAWPAALVVHGLSLQRAAPLWPAAGQHLAHAVGALLLGMLGASVGQGLGQTLGDSASAWPWLGWLAAPALLLLGLTQPSLHTRWPLRLAPEAYTGSASAVMAVALLLWAVLANVISNGSAQPLPYLPLLNPLDLGVALALVAVWRWCDRAAGRELLSRWALSTRGPWVVLGAVGFVWLNAMLVRGFHHLADVPFRLSIWTQTLSVQTGLTLLWTATALPLMWWGARRAQRGLWMVGAGLLAAVVFKLLLVDLSGTGTVTRIVSFIGAGVLMLVIGYVAPLPARPPQEGPSDAKA